MDKYDLLQFCGVPKRPINHVRRFYDEHAYEFATAESSLLWGTVGSGKTTAACIALATRLFESGEQWLEWELMKFDRKQCSDSGEKNGKPVPTFYPDYQPEYPWQFIKLLDFFSMIKNTFGRLNGYSEQQILEKYIHCELLVLDDLGVEMTTPWNYQILYQLIDSRYDAMLPTIYTSNFSIPELTKKIGDNRIISRIIGDCSQERIIEICQTDRRLNGGVY